MEYHPDRLAHLPKGIYTITDDFYSSCYGVCIHVEGYGWFKANAKIRHRIEAGVRPTILYPEAIFFDQPIWNAC